MTVDERLRRAHARIPAPDEATIARAHARLTAVLDEAPPPAPRRARRRFAFLIPALAFAAAVVAVFVLARGGDDIEREAPPAATGPVSYQRNTFQSGTRYITADGSPNGSPGNAAYAIVRSVAEEIWRAPDGSGRVVRSASSEPFLPSAADERAWRAAGSPDLKRLSPDGDRSAPETRTYGPGELDNALLLNASFGTRLSKGDPLAAMPDDPRALRAWLNATAGGHISRDAPAYAKRITLVYDAIALLRDARATQQQRLALIDVLSTVDGARKLASVRDDAGREWPGIEFERQTILYNPRSGALMAQGDRFKGGVRWVRTFSVASGGVAAVGKRP